jgi:hypothetical protein
MTAVITGARPNVNDMVCRHNGLGVVFDNQYGIAVIPKGLESFQQATVVPLMEANARFIQNIENTYESGADLGGEAKTLGLAA